MEHITSISFDKIMGIFVTFFGGIFKTYEPILFKQDWYCNINKTSDRAYDDESEGAALSITCSDLSSKLQFFAIGC